MTGVASRVRAIVRYSGPARLRAAWAGMAMAVSRTVEPGVAKSAPTLRSACVMLLFTQARR
eukprot:13632492-Alexandrium_andersonii.AAC.1